MLWDKAVALFSVSLHKFASISHSSEGVVCDLKTKCDIWTPHFTRKQYNLCYFKLNEEGGCGLSMMPSTKYQSSKQMDENILRTLAVLQFIGQNLSFWSINLLKPRYNCINVVLGSWGLENRKDMVYKRICYLFYSCILYVE